MQLTFHADVEDFRREFVACLDANLPAEAGLAHPTTTAPYAAMNRVGGTSEIQRDIIAQRLLDLPRN